MAQQPRPRAQDLLDQPQLLVRGGAVLGLSLVFFGRGFLALFTDSAEVAAAGMHRLCIMGFSYAISAFMDCTIAASRGLGRCVVPTIIVVLGSCVFRVIWVYTIFASVGTIASLYLLYPVSWTLTAGAEMVYFLPVPQSIPEPGETGNCLKTKCLAALDGCS